MLDMKTLLKLILLKRIEEKGLQELFGEILIPSAKMKHFFECSDDIKDQQLFPGICLLKWKQFQKQFVWLARRRVLSRFLGGKEPVPFLKKKLTRIIAQMKGEVVVSTEKHAFEVGREVEIKEGPFAGFVGIIDNIDEENEKFTVMVSIFGRMTPVELSFDQVKR